MSILVTGGAGYIGSHTVKLLKKNNSDVVVFDNLSRGHKEALPSNVTFENVDLLNFNEINKILKKYTIDAVIHFAAFAYVGESVEKPSIYYRNNVIGAINLLNALKENGIQKIIFSSTCSIYGNPQKIPITEKHNILPINPYAKTKYIIENILEDYDRSYNIKYVSLRYFNAAGADFNAEIGESHNPETHLIPIVIKAALEKRGIVYIYGDDYETEDGTCVRDYVHVNDLAEAHIKAMEYLNKDKPSEIFNLGTGIGFSVKEIISIVKKITNTSISVKISNRREGDPPILVADNKKAYKLLGWSPNYVMLDIVKSAYKWFKNPKY